MVSTAAAEASFVFVRHGQTTFNLRGVLAGATDVPLTEQGVREAERTAAVLSGETVRRVYVSPLRRAAETGRIIAAVHGIEPVPVEAFRERSWGELEGKTFPADLGHPHPPGGESMGSFLERLKRGVESIFDDARTPGVVVVAHGGVFHGLCTALCGAPLPGVIGNAVPARFRYRSGVWDVVLPG